MLLDTIYKETKGGKIQQWQIEVVGNRYRTISGQTDGKLIVSEWTVVSGKNEGRSNSTTDEEQAVKEAEAKRKLKLERGYFQSVSDVGEKQYFEPMLATKWEDRKDKVEYPIYSQPKLDGIRCIVSKNGMFSRNGKPIVSAPHIFEALKPVFDENPEYIFDGELYADKFANDFNKIVSLVKKTKPTAEDLVESKSVIEYHIYDFPSCKKKFSTRIMDLALVFLDYQIGRVCKLVSTQIVFGDEEVMELYGNYVDEGYEGQMLRLDKPYENKRSNSLMKHKSFMDEEFTILDIVEGEGNRTGTAGYFVFKTKDGKPFKSNVKGTFAETAEMLRNKSSLIGKEATVKYFALTPDGIPRFPFVINIGRGEYE
jgi:DNA ligase-1